jgi:hypothetical protein
MHRFKVPTAPLPLLGLSVAAGLATAGLEALWYARGRHLEAVHQAPAHQGEEEPAPVDRVRDVDLRFSVAAGLATAGLEALWYALATGVPASAVLSANLDHTTAPPAPPSRGRRPR